MRFTIFQDSRVGDRQGNEDRVGYSYSRDVLMMVVCDGMGGHAEGEVAAQIAVSEITRRFQQAARNRLQRPFEFIVSAIQGAHQAIMAHAAERNLLECPRTTCVLCVVQGGRAYWAHAGDSRLYVVRNGEIAARTQDHSKIQQMIDSGQITAEQAARHPDRNKIYSCLGGVVPPQIDMGRDFKLEVGDTVLLSTDGFWTMIPVNLLGAMLRKQPITALLPGLLTEAQRRAAGESDNISVVAMTWEDQQDSGVADTELLSPAQFASSTDTTQPLGAVTEADGDVSEDDIERAIAEIQTAIRKVPR